MTRRVGPTLGLVPVLLAAGAAALAQDAPAPRYDDAFWRQWGDGKAELASYELTFPRYGAPRRGTAVAITVTEDFRAGPRVKAESSPRPADAFPALKLNLIKDFSTGVYDYNLMLSAFVALAPVEGRPAGSLTKVAFSCQEWCGQVYQQLLFDADGVRSTSHSYFEAEADQSERLPHPAGGVSEDGLLLWARGLAGPVLEPGQRLERPCLVSTQWVRLRHRPLVWTKVTLSRAAEPEQVTVPAGTFAADVLRAELEDGRSWTWWVERAAPRRLLRWESSEGEVGALLACSRMKYWELNGPGGEAALKELGLTPRPPRTP